MPEREHGGPPWMRDDRHPGWGPGAGFFRRIIGVVLFLILAGPVLGFFFSRLFFLLRTPHRWVLGGLLVLGLVAVATMARSSFGRTWRPVGELIDATRRLGDGETGVRIPITGPGPLAAVSGSFNRMATRLEEEDERRRRLLADLGHELRTPLTVIRGEIEAVLDGVHDPQGLGNVIDEVELMERLLDDLRVLTLAEAGRLQLHKEPTHIETLLRDVLASFATVIEERDVETITDFGPGLEEFEADPHRLRQVLANLVSNALNQMHGGGSLVVSARPGPGSIRIEIADTGPGIPEDRLEQVFDRFVKSGDSAGSGLGLSIARDLVQAHGGTIAAANRPDGGAVFTVELPM
jgi:two-component system sensor histidine kinase BaeS